MRLTALSNRCRRIPLQATNQKLRSAFLFFCPSRAMSADGVRREKAALSSGCKSHPATAPAGSNRSSYGGNEVAEAFG